MNNTENLLSRRDLLRLTICAAGSAVLLVSDVLACLPADAVTVGEIRKWYPGKPGNKKTSGAQHLRAFMDQNYGAGSWRPDDARVVRFDDIHRDHLANCPCGRSVLLETWRVQCTLAPHDPRRPCKGLDVIWQRIMVSATEVRLSPLGYLARFRFGEAVSTVALHVRNPARTAEGHPDGHMRVYCVAAMGGPDGTLERLVAPPLDYFSTAAGCEGDYIHRAV